jgi:hypothetical protein
LSNSDEIIVHNPLLKKLNFINDKISEMQLEEGDKELPKIFEKDKTTIFSKNELKKKLVKSRSRHNHFKES